MTPEERAKLVKEMCEESKRWADGSRYNACSNVMEYTVHRLTDDDKYKTIKSFSSNDECKEALIDMRFSAILSVAERAIREDCAEIARQRSVMMPHDNDLTRGYTCGRIDAYHAILASIPEK